MKKYFWVFFVFGGLVLGPANGVLASGSGQIDKELDKIMVTTTKTEHTLADVPEETTVITAEEIKMQNAVNALDALRWVPGISVDWSGHASSETYMVNGAKSGFTLILIDGNRAKWHCTRTMWSFPWTGKPTVSRFARTRVRFSFFWYR